MILTDYQIQAVEKLIHETKRLLSFDGQKTIVFEAPTGSGKTVMMAAWLDQLAKEQMQKPLSFLWISTNDLHTQSKNKIEKYIPDSRYTLSFLEEINALSIDENQIAFANWASLTRKNREGEWNNVEMRDGDIYKSLRTRVNGAKEEGREIILIVDESHETFWSTQTQQFIDDVISPRLIIEVSATPKITVTMPEYEAGQKSQVTVKFGDVVRSGVIKEETVINAEIGKYKNFNQFANEALIEAALARRTDLKERYIKQKTSINPLVLIQLPSEKESLSDLDKSVKEKVIDILKEKHNITFENGKLAIWLTGDQKQNLDGITDNDNEVEVLIFKTAIAKGWDCPRADILLMLREMRSVTFKIQTVGRIMRMPELKHYADKELNRAFVYSNVPEVKVDRDDASQKYFAINIARRRDDYKEINLPSVYLSRGDYGDLTYKFREFFVRRANEHFDIKVSDSPSIAYKKADKDLELYLEELNTPVLADAVIQNIDQSQVVGGEKVEFKVPADEIKYKYAQFAKIMSLPFAPIRSHTKIQEAFYDWFDDVLGFSKKSRIEIQRIIVCSEANQVIFQSIIERAKEDFRDYKRKNIVKKVKLDYPWDVPEIEYLSSEFVGISGINKFAAIGTLPTGQKTTFLQNNRSNPEKNFEIFLVSHEDKIDWWYKNGEGKKEYFGILYEMNDGEHVFYPDYIVRFKDGRIGIYETKDENDQQGSTMTKAKAEAFANWVSKQGRKDIHGGIVIQRNGQWLFNESKKYNWGDWSDWKILRF